MGPLRVPLNGSMRVSPGSVGEISLRQDGGRGSRFAIQQGDRLPVVDCPAMQQQEQPAQPVVSLADFQTSDEESGESSGDEAPSLGPAEEFVLGTRRAFSMS